LNVAYMLFTVTYIMNLLIADMIRQHAEREKIKRIKQNLEKSPTPPIALTENDLRPISSFV